MSLVTETNRTPVGQGMTRIPECGMPAEEIRILLEEASSADLERSGRSFGYVYDGGPAATELSAEAVVAFMAKNALDPSAYPSLVRFEQEVVAMCIAHLGGDARTVGTFTSGGTESCILAVMAAREHARSTGRAAPELGRPEMILPITAHACFHKAAHYFDIDVVAVPVDPDTLLVDPAAIEAAIGPRTILIVASAPGYAHGGVDPIEAIGALADARGLLFHVDACIGGFLLPYLRRLGAEIPAFDLGVGGVTSISMDLHKYAYAPKGSSIVLYRDPELRAGQYFSCASWTGYTVVNPTLQSTKSGGPLAGSWAVMNTLGEDGYLEIARQIAAATERVMRGIEAIEGLEVMGRPDMSLVAFTCQTASVFRIADAMKSRGFYVQPQLAYGASRENLHLTIGAHNGPLVEEFLAALAESVEDACAAGESPVAAQVAAALAGEVGGPAETLAGILEMIGLEAGSIPEQMADVNEVLNVLPPPLREQLLGDFLGGVYSRAR